MIHIIFLNPKKTQAKVYFCLHFFSPNIFKELLNRPIQLFTVDYLIKYTNKRIKAEQLFYHF